MYLVSEDDDEGELDLETVDAEEDVELHRHGRVGQQVSQRRGHGAHPIPAEAACVRCFPLYLVLLLLLHKSGGGLPAVL